jgi:hypothetical protein
MGLEGLVLMPAIVVGIVAGIVDLGFMIKDESGDAKRVLGHGLAAFIPIIVMTFISFNMTLVTSLPALASSFIANEYAIRSIFVLFLIVYIHGKSKLFKGVKAPGGAETWTHSLMIAVLIGLAPYIWPLAAPMLPTWLGGTQ